MDFILLDLKTANENRNSLCFIRVLVVKNNRIEEDIKYFITPKYGGFNKVSEWINKFKIEGLKTEKNFDEVWKSIEKYFTNTVIVTHNSSFKISVLKEVLSLYKIKIPTFKFICTSKVFKALNPSFDVLSIDDLNKILRLEKSNKKIDEIIISFNIIKHLIEKSSINNLDYACKQIGIKIGVLGENYYKPCIIDNRKIGQEKLYSGKDSDTKFKTENIQKYDNINKKSFESEVVVFTRGLNSMKRHEAMEQVRRYGGSTSGTVNKRVTTLVVAVQDINLLKRRDMSTKHKKALDLNNKGQKIIILNEEEFLEKLEKIKLNL